MSQLLKRRNVHKCLLVFAVLVAILSSSASAQMIHAKDDVAIRELWNSTCKVSPYPTPSDDPCAWSHVKCTNSTVNGTIYRRITWIELKNLCRVPDSVGDFPDLEYMKISNGNLAGSKSLVPLCKLKNLKALIIQNALVNAIPACFGELKLVTQIDLLRNKLTMFPPICELTNLTSLILGRNELTSVPDCIGNLTKLTKLDLLVNKLSMLPYAICHLASLEYLDVYGNQLTHFKCDSTQQLANLTSLSISFNKITELSGSFLKGLVKLKRLNIASNRLSIIPDTITYMKELTSFIAYSNYLYKFPAVTNLVELDHLDLANNQLTQVPELANLTKLDTFSVSNNRIRVIPSLSNLTKLTTLVLFSNQLTTIPSLEKCKLLVNLYIAYNQLAEMPSLHNLGSLRFVDASSNKLREIPVSLQTTRNLLWLDLRSNLLETVPAWLGAGHTMFYYLYLSSNRLKKFECNAMHLIVLELADNLFQSIPTVVYSLASLERLVMSGNQLTTATFQSLSNLNYIDLSNNRISSLDQSLKSTVVDYLDVSNNALSEIPDWFSQLGKLEHFELSSNSIAQVKSLPQSLKSFIASSNQLKTLPPALSCIESIITLDVSANLLSDITLPLCGNHNTVTLSKLQKLDVSGNRITAFPIWFYNLKQLEHLSASSNHITALPRSLSEFSKLKSIDLSRNSIVSEGLPSLRNLSSLISLSLYSNALTVLPDWIGELKALKHLSLSRNQLVTLPDSLCGCTSLESVLLTKNELTQLPYCIGLMNQLRIILCASNRLTYLPLSLQTIPKLQQIDVSHNPFEYSLQNFMNLLKDLKELTLVSVAQSLTLRSTVELDGNPEWFPSLSYLDISSNSISGQLNHPKGSIVSSLSSTLSSLDISNNSLSGGLVDRNGVSLLRQLHSLSMVGNPSIVQSNQMQMPDMYMFDYSMLVHNSVKKYDCFGLKGKFTHIEVRIDPSYYNYQLCNCSKGTFGQPPSCISCQFSNDVAWCEQGQVRLRKGWWISNFANNAIVNNGRIKISNKTTTANIKLSRCPSTSEQSSNCLGTDNSGVFHCVKGSGGRMCGYCDSGYHRNNYICELCGSQAAWITLLIVALGALCIFCVAVTRKPSSRASVKIVMFYSQALSLLFTRVSYGSLIDTRGISNVIKGMLNATSGVTLVGFDCLVQNWLPTDRYIFRFSAMASIPLIVIVVVSIIGLFRLLWTKRCDTENQNENSNSVSLNSVLLFLLLFLYMPVSSSLLSVLGVDEDGYMLDAPWISTSDHVWNAVMLPIAVVGVIFYVIAFPLVLTIVLVLRARRYPGKPLPKALAMYAGGYVLAFPWFESVMMLKKLILVLVIALLPFHSAWVPTVVIGTVLGSLLINMYAQPYARSSDFWMEVVGLSVIQLCYVAGLLDSSGLIDPSSSYGVGWFVLLLSSSTLLLLIGHVAWPIILKIVHRFRIRIGIDKPRNDKVEMQSTGV